MTLLSTFRIARSDGAFRSSFSIAHDPATTFMESVAMGPKALRAVLMAARAVRRVSADDADIISASTSSSPAVSCPGKCLAKCGSPPHGMVTLVSSLL